MTGKVVENKNKSAQCFISNTAASIAPPVSEHISTTYSNLRGRRGGARGGEMAFRNYECFPSRNFLSFEKRKNFRLSDEVNRGVLLSVCRIIVGFLDEI